MLDESLKSDPNTWGRSPPPWTRSVQLHLLHLLPLKTELWLLPLISCTAFHEITWQKNTEHCALIWRSVVSTWFLCKKRQLMKKAKKQIDTVLLSVRYVFNHQFKEKKFLFIQYVFYRQFSVYFCSLFSGTQRRKYRQCMKREFLY